MSNQTNSVLLPPPRTRQIFFQLLLIASTIIFVVTAVGTAIAWDGNFLIVDGQGDYADLLTEGTVDVATNATESFTVEFWVSPTDYGAIIRDDAYDVGYIRHSFHDLDGILFRIWPDQVTSHDLFIPVVLFNGWHHVAVMFDNISDRGAIAVDGNVFWSNPLGAISGLLNINQPFYVGSFTSSSGFFTGKIDEVRISDSLRYPSYPGNSYTIPTLPFSDDPDTLALWHFDDTAGATSFLDSSGNGNTLTAHGDAVTASLTTGGSQTTLYLREHNVMTEEMGDPIPWVTKYIYPDSAPNSISWQTTLEGDITGSFDYSIDIVESAAPATLRIEFILDRDGSQSVVATDYGDVVQFTPPAYQTVSGTIYGLELSTQDGDRLILRVSHESGSALVGIGLDGQSGRSDSHVEVSYLGPVACFTLNPTEGDLLTEFNVNASCSADPDYSTSALEVRWDWEGDGTYDTNFRTAKSASH